MAAGSAFLVNLLVALGIGALVGLERERRAGHEVDVIAGVRTYPLFSLSGYLLAVVATEFDSPIVLAAGVLVMGLLAMGFLYMRSRTGILGLTSPMAMVVTFLAGMLIGFDFLLEAVVVGVATTFLLLTKARLHGFARHLEETEIMGALQFIAVAFILFPLVQANPGPYFGQDWIGRGRLVDPLQILLIVVFVSSIGFVSFLAIRAVGPRRGFEVGGLLGGLVNSEATTVSLATNAADEDALIIPAAVGVLLATATMFGRNIVILAFAAGPRAVDVVTYVAPMAIASALILLGAAWWWRRRGHAAEGVDLALENPFAIGPALQFAFLFGVVAAVASLLQGLFGDVGVYATAIGGFAYAGAVVASLGILVAHGDVSVEVAAATAGLALLAGAANKFAILRPMNPLILRKVAVPLGAAVAVGAVVLAGMLTVGAPLPAWP